MKGRETEREAMTEPFHVPGPPSKCPLLEPGQAEGWDQCLSWFSLVGGRDARI